ncbi:DDE superfamily endonuclease [Actinocorallia herbida]|uniref:DDE superfamily endonuclease n=1 Tax=Actinocorallia herbida TaxID=58109 RepID=A0A3N1CS20_9ACTN|nr:transposase family protein [Actinocorallia herbida]ROO83488.1 DDE superfamily endonuclease [Actinocorallia herbida]ROO87598.1 DDE superfamily endonuclease [Actinocorallia herbida]ROO87833.1 DDE superfamily endonuclease [Actinocorallia herbida]ROO87971.1 DDE superfamily endonuclease [Actinocorallia herbida]
MLFYRAAVDLSRSTLNYVAGLIRRHRRAIGSAWRLLNPGRQALLVLVHLRKGETFAQLGAGFEVSISTAWRYVEEVVALLSSRSPKLTQVLRRAVRDGLHLLVMDGTLIRTDRVAADRPYYSAKHRHHGVNIQVIAGPDGEILWTSGALPGRTHDLTAARIWGILRELHKTGITVLADKGYQGAETRVVITPYKGRGKPASQKQANRSHARLRAPGERANAQLKSWKLLHRLRCSPSKAGHLVKAIAVLANREAR